MPSLTPTSCGSRLQRGLRFAIVVAERHQGLHDVGLRIARDRRTRYAEVGAELALELQQQALGGLLADARHLDEAARCPARVTACASSPTLRPDSIDSAMRGPTPEILISCRKVSRSAAVRKPNSSCASSRTTKWVSSVTRSPGAGRL